MNNNNKTVLPKLRLSEFNNCPKWIVKKLGKLSMPVEERAGSKKYTLLSVTSGVGLVSQMEKFGREIAGNAYKNYYVIKKDDFAYNKSATKQFPEGYISMLTEYEEAALPNSIFTCFRITDDECDPRFFDQMFHNNYHGTWLRKYIEVGARAHGSLRVDTKHLWNMPIALPTLREQQRIADCLSSLDELISAEDKKLTALKEHKKGLMQKLFPAEDKSVPEIRFGNYAYPWIRKKFYDLIYKLTGGASICPEDYVYMGVRTIPKSTVNETGVADLSGSKCVAKSFFAKNIASKISTNDLVTSLRDLVPSAPNMGRIVKIEGLYEDFLMPQGVYRIELYKEVDENFLIAYSNSDIYRKIIYTKKNGSTQVHIRNGDFLDIEISVPKYAEQVTIGNLFKNVDKLITAQAEKIETLKAHKTGLIQGLFPSIEEVSQ